MHVNEGTLVDEETLCLPLNFPLAYHMQEGNLENKGKISLLHEQWGKYEVYIPSENKRIRGDHSITYFIKAFNYACMRHNTIVCYTLCNKEIRKMFSRQIWSSKLPLRMGMQYFPSPTKPGLQTHFPRKQTVYLELHFLQSSTVTVKKTKKKQQISTHA